MIIFFDIAQDCSLGHLVELKLQKKKKKKKKAQIRAWKVQIGAEMIFSTQTCLLVLTLNRFHTLF